MLNVLSQQQKESLRKEYGVRRTVVILGAIISALIISLFLLIPSYFSFYVRSTQTEKELEQTKLTLDSSLKSEDLTAELNTAVSYVGDLKPFADQSSVYDIVRIFESRPTNIKIYEMSFRAAKEDVPAQVSVRGTAVDRESLKAFGRALESREEFKEVDLPVSNFVKEHDIDFSMTVVLK